LFFLFRDEPEEAHGTAESQRFGDALEPRPIVALSADVERDLGARHPRRRHCAQSVLHPFITLQSA
jgi:hypothetical protein